MSRILKAAIVAVLLMPLLAVPSFARGVGEPVFNNPRGSEAAQRAIINRLIAEVNAARRGDNIRFANYSFQDGPLTTALLKAYRRGVRVRLITNHHLITPSYKRLKKRLGNDTRKRSWVMRCDGSCRGLKGPGTQHSKFYLFSRSKRVMIGSANVTELGIKGQWNDLFVMKDEWMHARFVRLFTQMRNDQPGDYESFQKGPFKVSVYPKTMSVKADPIARAIARIGCKAGKGYGYHRRTLVRINLHGWTDQRGVYLAREVKQLWRNGCVVQMIWGDSIGGRVKTILRNVPHVSWKEGLPFTHFKVMMVNGRYGHDRTTKLVWTGSANWTGGYDRRDEVVLRIADDDTYADYSRWFNTMRRQYRI